MMGTDLTRSRTKKRTLEVRDELITSINSRKKQLQKTQVNNRTAQQSNKIVQLNKNIQAINKMCQKELK